MDQAFFKKFKRIHQSYCNHDSLPLEVKCLVWWKNKNFCTWNSFLAKAALKAGKYASFKLCTKFHNIVSSYIEKAKISWTIFWLRKEKISKIKNIGISSFHLKKQEQKRKNSCIYLLQKVQINSKMGKFLQTSSSFPFNFPIISPKINHNSA